MKYFDLHADTLSELFRLKTNFDANLTAVSNREARLFEDYVQCFAVCIENGEDTAFQRYKEIINYTKLREFSGVGILTVENLLPIADDIGKIEKLVADGVKTASLTWNYENRIAGGALSDGRLTPFGRRVIKELDLFGIPVDLSHLNRRSFYDTIDVCRDCLVTHSALCEVREHPRNITLEMAKAVVRKGGIIGVCFYPQFVGDDVFEGVYQNIYLLLQSVGDENIALGSDFDGAVMSEQLKKPSDVLKLYDFLLKKGIPNNSLQNIFYNNANRFYKRMLKKPEGENL